MAFFSLYPPLVYETEDGEIEVCAPEIPLTVDGSIGTSLDVKKIGAYSDGAVRCIARERDRSTVKLANAVAALKKSKKFGRDQQRGSQMWEERCHVAEAEVRALRRALDGMPIAGHSAGPSNGDVSDRSLDCPIGEFGQDDDEEGMNRTEC